jgi:hypothetical protein
LDIGLLDSPEDLEPRLLRRFSAAWWTWLGARAAPALFMGGEMAEALLAPVDVADDEAPPPWWSSPGFATFAAIAPGNSDALAVLARLAETRGFVIDVIPSPVADEILAHPKGAAKRGAWETRMRDFCRLHPQVRLAAGLPRSYPRAQMQHGSRTHTGPVSSRDFLEKLAAHLRREAENGVRSR